jgi:hypothetical protein
MREDEYGHAVDEDGNLVYDDRCYFCLNEEGPAEVTVIRVEVTP